MNTAIYGIYSSMTGWIISDLTLYIGDSFFRIVKSFTKSGY